MASTLRSPITTLHGVGPASAKRLAALGLHHIYELLFHYPKRHEDYSQITQIADCPLAEPVTIQAEIHTIKKRPSWKRRRFSLTEATVGDGSGTLKITWFNQPYIAEQCKKGDQLFLSGKILENEYGLHMNNPLYERYKTDTIHTARIVPIYPTTYGLTQKQLRYFIKQALELLLEGSEHLPDWLPESIQEEYNIISLEHALQKIHFPENFTDIEDAKQRLGFEELLIVQLFVQYTKATLAKEQAQPMRVYEQALRDFVDALPFTLTEAQRQAAWQIIIDSTAHTPMNRLLEGDVGSGKTVVAALAMYNTALNGYQSLLMAPTEILAIQHFATISELLKNTSITISVITANRKDDANAQIIIGTHALIQKNAHFSNIGLVVVDEQHRFGVHDRQLLKQRSADQTTVPHLLSMTATPIPRSLALTIYGDLQLSIIQDLPHGRKPIRSELVDSTTDRKHMYDLIEQRVTAGEQVYIIAPRIEDVMDSDEEADPIISVTELYTQIQKQFPTLRVEQLHGKLAVKTKQHNMDAFAQGKIDILIATTVVEVGVNVPNATVIIIEEADRFGLAQLHQLRGRVGRSDKQSYCFVCTRSESERTRDRLEYFVSTHDGFQLAEYDLELRGPGDVYGKQQSGFLNYFRIAKLSDHALIAKTQTAAITLYKDIKNYPAVKTRLDQFIQRVHLE